MTPEFLNAVERCSRLAERFGRDHPDVSKALAVALELAPAEVRATIRRKAAEMGLLPQAFGYLENGEPVYRLVDLAAKMGVRVSTVERTANALALTERLADGETIHRRH